MNSTRKIDLDRVRQFFQDNDFKFTETDNDNAIATAFSGIGVSIRYNEPDIALATTVAVESLQADRFEDLLSWVEKYNSNHAFPTAIALKDEEKNLSAFAANFVLPGAWEYSDQQFADQMGSGINGVATAVMDFLREFSPESLEKLNQS